MNRHMIALAILLAVLAVSLAFKQQPELLDPGGDVLYFDRLNWLSTR